MAESSSGASSPSLVERQAPVGSTGADETSDVEVNWKEKYNILEASLHKFKLRAAQIREMLATKVRFYVQLIFFLFYK